MRPVSTRLLAMFLLLLALSSSRGFSDRLANTSPALSTPQWLTFYDTDLDPVRGQQNFSNLVFSDLGTIDNASREFGIDGMWAGPWGCEVNVSRVWGEPYCSGPTGLWKGWGGTAGWQVGADWVVEQIKPRPHVRGVFLGDEPTNFGVTYSDICALSLYLKRALLAAGRRDVFIYFNDTPESQQLRHGLCPGLDFFSLDSYNDDPATEVAQVQRAYSLVKARLRPPNDLEPRGQGFFVVPGIFWFMPRIQTDPSAVVAGAPSCTASGGTVCTGPHMYNCSWTPNGTHCLTSPSWLVGKMDAYWTWARVDASIVGFNVWHWADLPGMDPPSFRRGAVSLGPQLRQWFQIIHGNISAVGPRPLPLPPPPPPKPPLPADNIHWDPGAHGQSLKISPSGRKATWPLAHCRSSELPQTYKRVGSGYCNWYYTTVSVSSVDECASACAREPGCIQFSYPHHGCRVSSCGSDPGPEPCPADQQCPIADRGSSGDVYHLQCGDTAGCNEAVRTTASLVPVAALQRQQGVALTVQLQVGRALAYSDFKASVGLCTGASQNFSNVGHYNPLLANESWMYSATGQLINSSATIVVTPWSQPPKGVGRNGDVPSANVSVQLVTATTAEGDKILAKFFLNDEFVGSLPVPSRVPLFGCATSCANGTVLGMRVKLDDDDACKH
eukprot:COSAG02_NODE_2476_length_8733_cov_9.786542_5_plen_669_part_00